MSYPQRTVFLNVDLDVVSRRSLGPLVDALGDKVIVLYAGREGRRHAAHFELARVAPAPDANRVIRRLVALIAALPRGPRKLWVDAQVREFNIGIEAAAGSPPFELRLAMATIDAIRRVDGEVVVTVYGPPGTRPRRTRSRKAGSS